MGFTVDIVDTCKMQAPTKAKQRQLDKKRNINRNEWTKQAKMT